ncbi:recombinase family protein [Paenibacillus chitinolyticus]|uniref:recombinase family protein n=1 Tax=Paenibacillus chitinolyticus TaxID=79263 RepID=UPI001C488D0B|nr:recombinase family protein [Paenibacillus chitinolyticus]MBV6715260.1 recombinase family protein [Paenibacillus chitinolyticus]
MRCAVYIRVSTDKEEQKLSLENQRSLFYQYLEDRGWDIFDFYVDIESGTTGKRENLQRLIQDAKARKFDVIVAKELSRLARNGALSYQIRDMATDNSVHIVTLDNAINTLERRNEMFGLYAWIYEQESQRTSTRIKAALSSKAKKGEFKGSVPPYGYRLNSGKLVLAEDDTPNNVRRIFRMYLEGKGFDAIARTLTREGCPTPAQVIGKKNAGLYWHGTSIKKILNNPHYVGDLVQGRQTTVSVTSKVREEVPRDKQIITEDSHHAIISRRDFEAVQQYMQGRKQQQAKPKAKKHLFTNYLYCADCGKALWYVHYRKGYVCGNYYKHGKHVCSQHGVKEKELINVILTDIRSMAETLNEKEFMGRLEVKTLQARKQAEKQIQSLQRRIEKLKEQKTGLIRLLASGTINETEYKEATESGNAELCSLQEQLKGFQSLLASSSTGENIVRLKKELKQFMKLDELTSEMVHRLVDRIEVQADGSVNIHYKFTPTALLSA